MKIHLHIYNQLFKIPILRKYALDVDMGSMKHFFNSFVMNHPGETIQHILIPAFGEPEYSNSQIVTIFTNKYRYDFQCSFLLTNTVQMSWNPDFNIA